MEYSKAIGIALKIVKDIEPFTSFCAIAGSIRREKQEVKDIEIVAVPRITNNTDLFGNIESTVRDKRFVNYIKEGSVIKGNIELGRMVQIMLPENIVLDLFIPQEQDRIRQYAIRTGSSEYSHKVLATAWLKIGWVGTHDGLRREEECYKKDIGNGKHLWMCNSKAPTLPPIFENEYDFFKFLGLEWKEPKYRNV